MAFKKGESGNPDGRPTGPKTFVERMTNVLRLDGWINIISGLGTRRDRRMGTWFEGDVTTDQEAVHQWRSDDMTKRIIEAKPTEAMRRGYRIRIPEEHGGKEASEKIHAALEDLEADDRMTRAACYENAYGGSALFMVTEDAGDLSQPLDEGRILKVAAYHVLEPRELQPETWYQDIGSTKFREPETWRVMPLTGGAFVQNVPVIIHESRLIVFPGIKISSQVLPGQRNGWGDSILSRCNRVLADFANAWGSAAHLLTDFAQGVIKLDGLSALLKEKDGEYKVRTRLTTMEMMRSTIRSLILDGKDSFERTVTPVNGLDSLLVQFSIRLAAAAEQPVTKLFGTAPQGMNATGEGDRQNWYDDVQSYQVHRLKNRIQRQIKILMLSTDGPTGGVEPPVWSIEFNPLYTPTAKEMAEERYVVAQSDQIWYNIGAASNDDIAYSHWGGDTWQPELTIDWEAREAQKKAEEEAAELAKEREFNAPPPADPNDPNAPVDPNAPPPDPAADPKAKAEPAPIPRES